MMRVVAANRLPAGASNWSQPRQGVWRAESTLPASTTAATATTSGRISQSRCTIRAVEIRNLVTRVLSEILGKGADHYVESETSGDMTETVAPRVA